jgi:hypothetical protein
MSQRIFGQRCIEIRPFAYECSETGAEAVDGAVIAKAGYNAVKNPIAQLAAISARKYV